MNALYVIGDNGKPVAIINFDDNVITYRIGDEVDKAARSFGDALNAIIFDERLNDEIIAMTCHSGGIVDNSLYAALRNQLFSHVRTIVASPRTKRKGHICRKCSDDIFCSLYSCDGVPESMIVPQVNPHYFLLHRKFVILCGGFDVFSQDYVTTLYASVMKWSRKGYSSIIANACILNVGACTQNAHMELQGNDEEIAHRYSEYVYAKSLYKFVDEDPVVRYARMKSLHKNHSPRVLFYFEQVLPSYNGTSEFSIGLLNSFVKYFHDRYVIAVIMQKRSYSFHKDSLTKDVHRYVKVFHMGNEDDVTRFAPDVVFISSQYFDPRFLYRAADMAPRVIHVLLDAISWRSYYIGNDSKESLRMINALATKFSDAVVTISDYARDDISDVISDIAILPPQRTVYLSAHDIAGTNTSGQNSGAPIVSGKYVLIVGNNFSHKMLHEAVYALRKSSYRKVVIGNKDIAYDLSDDERNRFTFIASGKISHNDVDALYAHAETVIFPSIYEGFGLPIFHALTHAVPVVIHDNALNREVVHKVIGNNIGVMFFDIFPELESVVNVAMKLKGKIDAVSGYTWKDVAGNIEEVIGQVVNSSINREKVLERYFHIKMHHYGFGKVMQEHGSNGLICSESSISVDMLYTMTKVYLKRKILRYGSVFFRRIKRYFIK